MHHLICHHAFEAAELVTKIDWENVPANVATMVTGLGQMVYLKGYNVTVYEKDSEGKEQTRKPNREGQLLSGTELYITRGKFKEV